MPEHEEDCHIPSQAGLGMWEGALFLHLKPDEYLKKLDKTKNLVEKTSFSLQDE